VATDSKGRIEVPRGSVGARREGERSDRNKHGDSFRHANQHRTWAFGCRQQTRSATAITVGGASRPFKHHRGRDRGRAASSRHEIVVPSGKTAEAVLNALEWTRTTTGKTPHKALSLIHPPVMGPGGVQIVQFVGFSRRIGRIWRIDFCHAFVMRRSRLRSQ
jgi:hypothetical protein